MTPSTPIISGAFILKKYGNLVALTTNGKTIITETAITDETVMCTIPTEYRPTGGFTTRSHHSASNVQYPMDVSISASGDVRFKPLDNSGAVGRQTKLYWTDCIMWIID